MIAPRLVSLVPCITETLLAQGLGGQIVGRTRYCPPVDGAAEIGGVWDPDIDGIAALVPDRVYVDPEEHRPADLAALEARLPVARISVRSVADALRFAGTPGAPVGPPPSPALPVIVPIWLRPLRLLGVGRYGDALLRAAGFENRIREAGYPAPGGDDLDALGAARAGAILLLPTEPWAFDEADAMRYDSDHRWRATRVLDGRDLFWYGARTLGALARLRTLHGVLAEGGES